MVWRAVLRNVVAVGRTLIYVQPAMATGTSPDEVVEQDVPANEPRLLNVCKVTLAMYVI